MYLILVTGADSGYCPVPCGIPQGSRISMFERACYVRIRPDPDVPREGRKTKSGGQLSTVLTRTRAGETRARQEEIQDGWS